MAFLIRNIIKQSNIWQKIYNNTIKLCSTAPQESVQIDTPDYLHLNSEWDKYQHSDKLEKLLKNVTVHENFLSEEEEHYLMSEVEPYLKRLRYEFDHWDDAIHGYRETEKLMWNEKNKATINRLREIAFPKLASQLKHVHVLDISAKGYIKPHIDAVRFCGNIISGLSLLSDSVMRLVHDQQKEFVADILLKRRSLYIIKDTVRYDYTHEILKDELSYFRDKKIPRERRISIICRNVPSKNIQK